MEPKDNTGAGTWPGNSGRHTGRTGRILLYSGLIGGMAALLGISVCYGYKAGAVFAVLPVLLCCALVFLHSPKWYALVIFIVSYLLPGLSRYFDSIKPGIVFDGMILSLLGILLIHTTFFRMDWRRVNNGLTFMVLGWGIYCFLLLFNPESASYEAWLVSIRWTAIYFFLLVLITPLVITRLSDIKVFLYTWSVLTLLAVGKAVFQKFFGFDEAEKYWLYVFGAARTHIIYSGIRYFSIFSDAANFGASMGLSTVVFGILALYFKSIRIKIYFGIVALLSFYGLIISGTRSSVIILFVGLAVLTVLSRKWTYIILGAAGILLFFSFLKFTTFGNGNQYIRRMRTALDTQDASYRVRVGNRERMRTYMADKPFGIGIGLGGSKAQRYNPQAYMAQIPTDSWLVSLWVETGIVGLLLYLLLFFVVLIYGTYQALFRIRDKLLRGIEIAMIAGVAGVLANSYVNEVFAQFPNGVILFICVTVIFIIKYIDRDITGCETPEKI